jgi:hypothetical protein
VSDFYNLCLFHGFSFNSLLLLDSSFLVFPFFSDLMKHVVFLFQLQSCLYTVLSILSLVEEETVLFFHFSFFFRDVNKWYTIRFNEIQVSFVLLLFSNYERKCCLYLQCPRSEGRTSNLTSPVMYMQWEKELYQLRQESDGTSGEHISHQWYTRGMIGLSKYV